MAVPLLDTLTDLLSASSGALVGAIVTGLFSRGRNRRLSERVMASQQELEKQQLENERLLAIIEEKENFILALAERKLTPSKPKTTPKKKRGK